MASGAANAVSIRHVITISPDAQSEFRHGPLARYGGTVRSHAGDVHRCKVWERHGDDEEEDEGREEEDDARDTEYTRHVFA